MLLSLGLVRKYFLTKASSQLSGSANSLRSGSRIPFPPLWRTIHCAMALPSSPAELPEISWWGRGGQKGMREPGSKGSLAKDLSLTAASPPQVIVRALIKAISSQTS